MLNLTPSEQHAATRCAPLQMSRQTTTRRDFYVTHATQGNLFWRHDGTPHYFATRAQAERALASYSGDTSGYYVAEYSDVR